MSKFTLPHDLTEGTTASAVDVMANFEAIAELLNGLFQQGKVSSSAQLTLSGSYQDISGVKAEVTVPRASKVLLWTDVQQEASEGWSARVTIDGTEIAPTGTESGFFVASLETGPHTIKMQGKGSGKILSASLLYLVIPDLS